MTITSDRLAALISGGENSILEFKEGFPAQARDLAHEVAAFGSSGGGYLVLGVTDAGEMVGIHGAEHAAGQAAIRGRLEGIFKLIRPALVPTISFVEVGAAVCLIDVPGGKEPPYWVDGRPYVRIGSESRPATPEEVRALVRAEDGTSRREDAQRLVAELTRLAQDLRKAYSDRGPRVFFLGVDDPPHVRARDKAEDDAVQDAEFRVRAYLEASAPAYLNDWDSASRSGDRAAVLDAAIREIRLRA